MPFSIEQHMCCDFCPKVNTDCVRLQGLHTAQRSCLDCLRAAVRLLDGEQEQTEEPRTDREATLKSEIMRLNKVIGQLQKENDALQSEVDDLIEHACEK